MTLIGGFGLGLPAYGANPNVGLDTGCDGTGNLCADAYNSGFANAYSAGNNYASLANFSQGFMQGYTRSLAVNLLGQALNGFSQLAQQMTQQGGNPMGTMASLNVLDANGRPVTINLNLGQPLQQAQQAPLQEAPANFKGELESGAVVRLPAGSTFEGDVDDDAQVIIGGQPMVQG